MASTAADADTRREGSVRLPYFMTASTGTSDDDGGKDIHAPKTYAGVAPLQSLIEIYEAMPQDTIKIRARCANAEHFDMLYRTDGYMTAWFLPDAQNGNYPDFLPYKIQSKITYKMDFAEHETGQDNRQVIVLFIKTRYNGPESEEIAWNAMYRPLR